MGTHTVFQCDVCGVEQRTSDFFQTPEGWTYVTCDSGVVEEQRRFLICSVCKRTARLQAGAATLWPPGSAPLSAPALELAENLAENMQRVMDETAVASEILTILNNAVRAGAGHALYGATVSINDGTITSRGDTYRITVSRT